MQQPVFIFIYARFNSVIPFIIYIIQNNILQYEIVIQKMKLFYCVFDYQQQRRLGLSLLNFKFANFWAYWKNYWVLMEWNFVLFFLNCLYLTRTFTYKYTLIKKNGKDRKQVKTGNPSLLCKLGLPVGK